MKEDLEYEERRVAKDLKKQQQQHEAALEAAVRAAREEGMRTERAETENKNNSQLLSLVKFLRLAGYRRTEKSDNPDEDQAIEDVLVLVYSGDQTAMSACTKLAAGTSDIVSEAAPGVTCTPAIAPVAGSIDIDCPQMLESRNLHTTFEFPRKSMRQKKRVLNRIR